MKYRIIKNTEGNWKFSQFFHTKKEAVAFQTKNGGTLQHKIGCEWVNY